MRNLTTTGDVKPRGTVGTTRQEPPITTSTTRTSTNPAPAPAPQRAVTSAIDQQRQSAADTTPAAVKKQNAAVMNLLLELWEEVYAYSGYNTGVQRGEYYRCSGKRTWVLLLQMLCLLQHIECFQNHSKQLVLLLLTLHHNKELTLLSQYSDNSWG